MHLVKSLALVAMSVVLSVGSILGLSSYHKRMANDFTLLRQATYQVIIVDRGTCSGVLVADNKMLTAAHCVPKDGMLEVNGKEAKVLKVDEVHDVALLEVDALCPCVPLADNEPLVDAQIAVLGFPIGMGEYLTFGRVQGDVLIPSPLPADFPTELLERIKGYFLVSANIGPGNSGGPVFQFIDGSWKVVGITSAAGVASLGGIYPALLTHVALMVKLPHLKALFS